MVKKQHGFILGLLFSLVILTTSALAAFSSPRPEGSLPEDYPATRSINKTITLDFSASTNWVQDFNNSAFGLNHNNVTVKYVSNSPSIANAYVWVELYIDDDKDGTYEQYAPDGSYRFGIKKGDTLQISLPYGRTEKEYRLRFSNRTSTVDSAVFEVESFYN